MRDPLSEKSMENVFSSLSCSFSPNKGRLSDAFHIKGAALALKFKPAHEKLSNRMRPFNIPPVFYRVTQRVFITALTASKFQTSTLIMFQRIWQGNSREVPRAAVALRAAHTAPSAPLLVTDEKTYSEFSSDFFFLPENETETE